jgi:hypothetical protein
MTETQVVPTDKAAVAVAVMLMPVQVEMDLQVQEEMVHRQLLLMEAQKYFTAVVVQVVQQMDHLDLQDKVGEADHLVVEDRVLQAVDQVL